MKNMFFQIQANSYDKNKNIPIEDKLRKEIPLDLSSQKRESEETACREPPERASFVDFSKKSSISSVLMLALHAFLPFLDPFAFFPILTLQWLRLVHFAFLLLISKTRVFGKNHEFTVLLVAAEHKKVMYVMHGRTILSGSLIWALKQAQPKKTARYHSLILYNYKKQKKI